MPNSLAMYIPLKIGIQNPSSNDKEVERIQNCLGFPYMGDWRNQFLVCRIVEIVEPDSSDPEAI